MSPTFCPAFKYLLSLIKKVANSQDTQFISNSGKRIPFSRSSLTASRSNLFLSLPLIGPRQWCRIDLYVSESPAIDQTHQAVFMLLTRAKLHWANAGSVCAVLKAFGFSLHSGWQTSGLGGPGRQSHHCAVGLEERGEALCHAVSTVSQSSANMTAGQPFSSQNLCPYSETLTNLAVNCEDYLSVFGLNMDIYGWVLNWSHFALPGWKNDGWTRGKKGNYILDNEATPLVRVRVSTRALTVHP